MTRLSMRRISSSQRTGSAKRLGGQYGANISAGLTAAFAPTPWLRAIFSLAQAPLFCKEGM